MSARSIRSAIGRIGAVGWLLIGVFLVSLGAFALILDRAAPRASAAEAEGCEVPAERGVHVDEQAVLMPAPGELLAFTKDFEDVRPVFRPTAKLEWQEPAGPPAGIEVGDRLKLRLPGGLATERHARQFPSDQISYYAVAVHDGVEVSLCVDPHGMAPDVYRAALTFDAGEVIASPIPIEVTVQHQDLRMPLTAILLGVVIAIVVLILSVATASSGPPVWTIVVAVLVGGMAILVGAGPWSIWLDDPTWGKEPTDWFALAAGTALALLGSAAAGEVAPGLKHMLEKAPPPETATTGPIAAAVHNDATPTRATHAGMPDAETAATSGGAT